MQTMTQTPGYRYLAAMVLLAVSLALAGQCLAVGAPVRTPAKAPAIAATLNTGLQYARIVYGYPRYYHPYPRYYYPYPRNYYPYPRYYYPYPRYYRPYPRYYYRR